MVLCRVSWKRAERHQGHPQGHRAASEPGGKAGVVQPHNSKHSPGKAGQRLHPSSTGDPRETAAKEPLRGPDKDMGSGEAGETPQGAEGADSCPLWHQTGPIPCPCSHPTPLEIHAATPDLSSSHPALLLPSRWRTELESPHCQDSAGLTNPLESFPQPSQKQHPTGMEQPMC